LSLGRTREAFAHFAHALTLDPTVRLPPRSAEAARDETSRLTPQRTVHDLPARRLRLPWPSRAARRHPQLALRSELPKVVGKAQPPHPPAALSGAADRPGGRVGADARPPVRLAADLLGSCGRPRLPDLLHPRGSDLAAAPDADPVAADRPLDGR